jgi:hypothetical protein
MQGGTSLPTGAQELLIALQTPFRQGLIGIPTLIWSPPGGGKTSFLESLARPGFPVVTHIASIHDPTDYSGLPLLVDGRVRYCPPEWIDELVQVGDGILFLDEITTAPPSVQAALLRVVLERRIAGVKLPPRVRVVAAANPPELAAGGWELSAPLSNRFLHLEWNLSAGAFTSALIDGFCRPDLPEIDPTLHADAVRRWRLFVSAFLRRDAKHLRSSPGDDQQSAFASPRTWEYAIQLMASCDVLGLAAKPGGKITGVFHNLIAGSVGSGVAKAFVGFVKESNLPDPEELLDGSVTIDVSRLKDDELHVLFCGLSQSLLRRSSAKEQLLEATMIALDLIDQTNHNGRIDAVFTEIRRLTKGQVIHQAATEAVAAQRLRELQDRLNAVFEDTTLSKYIEALT